ncbi:MAG: hypothetical protein U5J63_15625 [Fodinibius sp.]|nr:hypothetical protein [Fodinibius sp.]
MNKSTMRRQIFFLLLTTWIAGMVISSPAMAQNTQLTFEDVMKWEDISDQTVSDNGEWMAYSVWPDRGDGRCACVTSRMAPCILSRWEMIPK